MYIPFFPDFVFINLSFLALGFGVAWAIQNLRQPPPLKRRARRRLDELDEDQRPSWARLKARPSVDVDGPRG